MPNRIIRPGINDSERVNQLDWPAEVFYRRMMSVVDDHGLYDARPAKLRADLYPLKLDRVREADVSRWLAECVKAGLVVLYEANSKPFLMVLDTRWQVRSEPKYPKPPDAVLKQLQAPDNSCAQLRTQAKAQSLSEAQAGAEAESIARTFATGWITANLPTFLRSGVKSFTSCVLRLGKEEAVRRVIELSGDRKIRNPFAVLAMKLDEERARELAQSNGRKKHRAEQDG